MRTECLACGRELDPEDYITAGEDWLDGYEDWDERITGYECPECGFVHTWGI